MFPGDEDNGSMSAWFILSAIGLYPLAPGLAEYQLGVPLFDTVQINLGTSQPLTIVAVNSSPENIYVEKITWNGNQLQTSYISYTTLMDGGTLRYFMTAQGPL